MDLAATVDQRAYELFIKWLELEKYKSLQAQIDKRLSVLDPLISQLEKVAEAGIGDVSKVTAAQRTVSAIRVEKTTVAEGLAQAQLNFSNVFGSLNPGIAFDYDFIANLVPSEISDRLVQNSPVLKSQYARYQSGLARVKALKAEDGFNVGLEVRALRPFAGSGYDSDESIGLVGRKTLFNGGMLDSEIKEAEAMSEVLLAQIKSIYRSGARSVEAAVQNIVSMEKAILIAEENARLTSDEIIYLRQQLIIGGSTLDSVLTAEARLYEAESKEIKFLTEKYKSQVLIISSLGLFSAAFGT
jgi:outer membrane protein TolC